MSEKKKAGEAAANLAATFVEDIKPTHDIPVNERIRLPIVWERITTGYRVQDLQPSKYQEAIELIKGDYFQDEVLCRGINVSSDVEAMDEYLNQFLFWIKDTQSLVAVEEGTGNIVGILVGRVLDRTVRTQWRFGFDDSVDDINKYQGLQCPNILDSSSDRSIKDPSKSNFDSKSLSNIENIKDKAIKSSAKSSKENEQFTKSYEKIFKITEKMNKLNKTISKSDENFYIRGKRNEKLVKSEEGTQKYDKSLKLFLSPKPSLIKIRSTTRSTLSKENSNLVEYLPQGRRLKPIFCDENVIFNNKKLEMIHKLKGYLVKKYDILEIYDIPVFYNIYLILVSSQHRNNGIGKAMMRSIMDVCRKFKCDVLCGVFTSKVSQNIAYKEGFMVHEEVYFNKWLENDEQVFEIVDTEDKIAFMSKRLEEPVVIVPPVPEGPPRRNKT